MRASPVFRCCERSLSGIVPYSGAPKGQPVTTHEVFRSSGVMESAIFKLPSVSMILIEKDSGGQAPPRAFSMLWHRWLVVLAKRCLSNYRNLAHAT